MDLQGVREALRTEPFRPFALRMADGRSHPVFHPDLVAVGKRRIVVFADDDSWSVSEVAMVVSLDPIKKTPPGSNGLRKWR